MSLINEALKRTQTTSGASSARSPMPAPARLHHASSHRAAAHGGRHVFGVWHFIAVAAIILALVGGAFGYVRSKVNPINQAISGSADERQAFAAPTGTSAPRGARRPVTIVIPPEEALNPATAENEIFERVLAAIHLEKQQAKATAQTPVPAPVPAVPAEPEPPEFKLQGIMRDGKSVEAMINGYNLKVGDQVDGYEVAAIEERVVRLQYGDSEIELRLR